MPQSQYPGEGMPKGGSQQDWDRWAQRMRQQAGQTLAQGAVTPAYKANRDEIIDLLNRALAAEWSSFLQYEHHYAMASDMHSPAIRQMWREHAQAELEHARKFNERINQIGGVPANAPRQIDQLTPLPFEAGHDLHSMLEVDLAWERAAIGFFNEVIRVCGFDDNETRAIFEGVLLEENEHANELANVLFQYDASTGKEIAPIHQQSQREQALRRAAN